MGSYFLLLILIVEIDYNLEFMVKQENCIEGSRGSNKDSEATKREHNEVLEAKELSVPSGLANPEKRVLFSRH